MAKLIFSDSLLLSLMSVYGILFKNILLAGFCHNVKKRVFFVLWGKYLSQKQEKTKQTQYVITYQIRRFKKRESNPLTATVI